MPKRTSADSQTPSKKAVKLNSASTPTSQQHHPSSKDVKLELPSDKVGDVFIVGSGDCGQLGLGPDVLEKERPAKLKYFDDKNIVMVYAGGLHNIALSNEGKLYSWGCNDQLALGRSGEETEPGPVEGLDDQFIVSVACGDSATAALTREGHVYNWGTFRNNTGIFGMQGADQNDTLARPTAVARLHNIISIASGSNHMVALSKEGKVYTWGVGDQGQLGRKILPRRVHDISLNPRIINFKPKGLPAKYSGVYCGSYHTFLVHEDGPVFGFGLNNYGQLGIDMEIDDDCTHVPYPLEGIDEKVGVSSIAGGEHHTMILMKNGDVYSCGRGDSGQIGHKDKQNQFKPLKLSTKAKATMVDCGASFSLFLTDNADKRGNNIYMTGYGEMGQLANHGVDNDVPTETDLNGRTVYCAAAGGQHTLFLLNKKQ